MKKTLLTICSMLIFISCQNNNQPDKLAKAFKPFLHGVWVDADYIDQIIKTKSPNKYRWSGEDYTSLIIDTDQISGDSLEVGWCDLHEGNSFVLYFRPGLNETSLSTNITDYKNKGDFFELGYELSGIDTSLVLYHYGGNRQLIVKIKYTKVKNRNDGDDADEGVQYIVNKKLITGTYTCEDKTGQSMTVQFNDDGKISGFPGFHSYYVNTDFMAGPENNLDEIFLDIRTKNQKGYAFTIQADTLNLYETSENNNRDSLMLGTLKYKLVKQ